MKWERYSVPVDLAITVHGDTEEERRAKLREALESLYNGHDLTCFNDSHEARIYGYQTSENDLEVMDEDLE